MVYFSIKLGKKIPFKIANRAVITIRQQAKINGKGRLNIGLKKHEAVISVAPVNIFLGEKSTFEFGHSVCIGQGVNIIVKNNATFKIGDRTYFTSDMHIESENEIVIGNNCAISWGVTIIDSNHHSVIVDGHEKNIKGSVHIGTNVWIGCNATILKDTVIGDNCVVAAGSVVKGNFPSNSLIAGNPAKILKSNVSWK